MSEQQTTVDCGVRNCHAAAQLADLRAALSGIRDVAGFVKAADGARAALQLVGLMLGHNHWDHTMQHGVGCELCIQQGKVMDAVRAAREAYDSAKGPAT